MSKSGPRMIRRRSLLWGAALAPLAFSACSNPEESAEGVAVAAGDYGLLLSTIGSKDPSEGDGRVVLLDPDGGVKGQIRFTPIDQAALVANGGKLAWLSAGSAHMWGDELRTWNGIPQDGHLGALLPAGDDVLAVISGGNPTSFALFGSDTPDSWEYPAWIDDNVAWTPRGALAFTQPNPGIGPRLEFVGPDTAGQGFGETVLPSAVWGSMVTIGDHAYSLVCPELSGGPAVLWRIDPIDQTVEVIPLSGPGSSPASWYTGSNGPYQVVALGDGIAWQADGSYWLADIDSGEVRELGAVPSGDFSWNLTHNALIGVRRGEGVLDVTHIDPLTMETVRELTGVEVEGSTSLHPMSAVLV